MAEPTDKIAPRQTEALAAAQDFDDLVQDSGRGTENIGADDVKPPRIRICQAGSPERKPDHAKQIKGLQELDIFNDLSGEIYGRGPLRFAVIQVLKPRGIEFRSMAEGGGVVDFDVPLDDPRMKFTTDPESGERLRPIATLFRDFLVWLPDHMEVAVLSMKGSQLKVAVQLNGKLKLPLKGEAIDPSLRGKVVMSPPAWARMFSITTAMEQDGNYAWGNYNLKMEGVTPPDVRAQCRDLADIYGKKNIIIEREPGDETDFPPVPEAGAAGADM